MKLKSFHKYLIAWNNLILEKEPKRLIKLEELSPRQLKALVCLAAGHDHKTVAEKCGVSIRSVEVWKSKPEFRRMLRDATARVFDQAIARLVLHAEEAADCLCEIIKDENASDKTKISAIGLLFTHTARARDWQLEHRLEQLETAIDGDNKEQATED